MKDFYNERGRYPPSYRGPAVPYPDEVLIAALGPAARMTGAKTIDELLAAARAVLPHRPSPAEALCAQADGAVLVDIRGDHQRRDGLIPGALVVPRNSLEWRCDPASEWRHPAITRHDLRIILVCHEGYQSSLAAATLQELGLVHATDLDGGFTAWAAAGLPVLVGQAVPADCHIGMMRGTRVP